MALGRIATQREHEDMSHHTFTLELRVHDAQELFSAARKHAIEVEGLVPEAVDEELKDGDEINVHACLVTLLDPGLMPGCDINDSSCEEH
jgi:hypothetical protein